MFRLGGRQMSITVKRPVLLAAVLAVAAAARIHTHNFGRERTEHIHQIALVDHYLVGRVYWPAPKWCVSMNWRKSLR